MATRENLATGAAVGADGRHSLSAAHDRCPVCGSTDARCRNVAGRPIAPHQARLRLRDSTSIPVPDHLAQAIDDLARRAECSPAAVLEWLIWAALRPCGVAVPRLMHWQTLAAWRRLEATQPSHPRHTENR